MTSVTAMGGPNRARRNPYNVLEEAVEDDMRQSTEETRSAVVQAKAAYEESEKAWRDRCDFRRRVSDRMRELTATERITLPAPAPKRSYDSAVIVAVIVAATFVVYACFRALGVW